MLDSAPFVGAIFVLEKLEVFFIVLAKPFTYGSLAAT
jgi:hypothetical protein